MLYDDGTIQINSEGLCIRNYYFPLSPSRKISFTEIQRVELKPLGFMDGRLRLWGMGLAPIWFHFDSKRLSKKYFLQIDLGKWMKVGITPRDMQTVQAILRGHMPHSKIQYNVPSAERES